MEGIEEKLGTILSDPEMMRSILSMAKTLGQSQPSGVPGQNEDRSQPPPSPQNQKAPPLGRNELEMISRISALSQQTGLDRQEQALLKALSPYLSRDRLSKLEKAMHAAKMARFATVALSQDNGSGKAGI